MVGAKGTQSKDHGDTDSTKEIPTAEVKKPNAYMQAKRLTEIETEIARLEATLKMYEVQVANPEVQSDPEEMAQVANAMEEVTTKLETLYEQWEALAE